MSNPYSLDHTRRRSGYNRIGWLVVAINEQSVERTNAAGGKQYLTQAMNNNNNNNNNSPAAEVRMTFRDPAAFRAQLQSLSSTEGSVATTQVAPMGDTTQRNPDGSVRSGRTVTTALADQRVATDTTTIVSTTSHHR